MFILEKRIELKNKLIDCHLNNDSILDYFFPLVNLKLNDYEMIEPLINFGGELRIDGVKIYFYTVLSLINSPKKFDKLLKLKLSRNINDIDDIPKILIKINATTPYNDTYKYSLAAYMCCVDMLSRSSNSEYIFHSYEKENMTKEFASIPIEFKSSYDAYITYGGKKFIKLVNVKSNVRFLYGFINLRSNDDFHNIIFVIDKLNLTVYYVDFWNMSHISLNTNTVKFIFDKYYDDIYHDRKLFKKYGYIEFICKPGESFNMCILSCLTTIKNILKLSYMHIDNDNLSQFIKNYEQGDNPMIKNVRNIEEIEKVIRKFLK